MEIDPSSEILLMLTKTYICFQKDMLVEFIFAFKVCFFSNQTLGNSLNYVWVTVEQIS